MINEIQGRQPGNPLTVMTFNVGTFDSLRPDMERVRQLIAETGAPDVLLFQEVPGEEEARNLVGELPDKNLIFHPYPSGRDGFLWDVHK